MLDGDPGLAAPWHQLFRQVKSPRHVLSELLQNADDAGATWAKAYVREGHFYFEHDGEDFTEDNLRSLCQFGFSNKRTMHTIGFRGIGFKSLFSLGSRIDLITPSLSVTFEEKRFTLPVWSPEVSPQEKTVIRIALQTTAQVQTIRDSLSEWTQSAIPLIFFNHIQTLDFGGTIISKGVLGDGPVQNSQKVSLSSFPNKSLLRIWSRLADFPPECVDEVRSERGDNSIQLPPAHVEILFGAHFGSSLFVILPTNVQLNLPFACNAPFIQDPARVGIKDPTISPTNRWLLKRVGSLAARSVLGWIRNGQLAPEFRAVAYDMIPNPPEAGEASGMQPQAILAESFRRVIESDGSPILLTTENGLAQANGCLDLPEELLNVWPHETLATLFGREGDHVLSGLISEAARENLARWGLLERKGLQLVYKRLASEIRPVRPSSDSALLSLWAVLEPYATRPWMHGLPPAKDLAIVPAKGRPTLYPTTEIVSMRGAQRELGEADFLFLAKFSPMVEPEWEALLSPTVQSPPAPVGISSKAYQAATNCYRSLNLQNRSGLATIIEQAAREIFDDPQPGENAVRLAQVILRARVSPPETFKYLCRDGGWRPSNSTILVGVAQPAREALPEDWLAGHELHEAYGLHLGNPLSAEQRGQMQLHRFPVPGSRTSLCNSFSEAQRFCKQRGGITIDREKLSRKKEHFEIEDYDFPKDLISHWEVMAREDPALWVQVIIGIASDWGPSWEKASTASIRQRGNSYTYPIDHGTLRVAWLERLQTIPCLPDTEGVPQVPATLLLHTPETSPLERMEAFVHPDLDTLENRPLLKLLGASTQPASAAKLIERLAALSGVKDPPKNELTKLYDALDRVAQRLPTDKRRELTDVFAKEALIFGEDDVWHLAGEIYLETDEIPGLPRVRTEWTYLALWAHVGVAARPTIEAAIEWLETLPVGQPLNPRVRDNVRAILRRAPRMVWEHTGHWLDLTRSWRSQEDLIWSVLEPIQGGSIFPWVQEKTADLTMLDGAASCSPPFSELAGLAEAIEWRTHGIMGSSGPVSPPSWVHALAHALLRIQGLDSDQESELQDARAIALDLLHSAWHPVRGIQVTPYLQGQPAGDSQRPAAHWYERQFYVAGTEPQYHRELVQEVAGRVSNADVRKAVADCIGRDTGWIGQYMNAHFSLLPLNSVEYLQNLSGVLPSQLSPEKLANSVDQIGEDTPTSEEPDSDGDVPELTAERPSNNDFELGDDSPEDLDNGPESLQPEVQEESLRKTNRANGDGPFYEWAMARGYLFRLDREEFSAPDGRTIRKDEGSFHWVESKHSGDVIAFYWVGTKPLSHGVDLPAEVWESLKFEPALSSLLLPGEHGKLERLLAIDLQEQVDLGKLRLYPARYILKRKNED
ncbi:MAG: sacsin N-terminal ATP-binding-like domain-containing protein [Acidobacteriota bacterium]